MIYEYMTGDMNGIYVSMCVWVGVCCVYLSVSNGVCVDEGCVCVCVYCVCVNLFSCRYPDVV